MRYTVQLDIVESAAHLFKEPSSNQVPVTRATNWFRTYILGAVLDNAKKVLSWEACRRVV